MITPRFSCSQTETSVVVSVYCPSVRASDVELNVDDTLFTLHINPYFLRLNFTHALQDDDEASSASYDPSSGYLTVSLTKAVRGQNFEDLDLLAKLLAPRKSERTEETPLIEVLDSQESVSQDDELAARTEGLSLADQEIFEAAENDWQIKQELPTSEPSLKTSVKQSYGFLNLYTGYFQHVEHTENEVNELGADAETSRPSERRQRRLKHENDKFDEEHYIADFADDEYIVELCNWEHPFSSLETDWSYTEEEKLSMLRLPRKEYLISPVQNHHLYLTLLMLLFSYAYDSRTTQKDPTPESPWTICSLTAAFSALDPAPYTPSRNSSSGHFDVDELIATFATSYRRSLVFPLHRSYALAEACKADVASFLLGGRRLVVRCLLELKDILDHHDVYYVYSKIWLADFCLWAQAYASDEAFAQLASVVSSLKVPKSLLGWDLDELEALVDDNTSRESDSDDESEDEVEQMLPAQI
ncbi:SHQ1-domain-containing protein [Irpex rosettiformis]|uniref:SHQ1-domain-containing protein n=1 Tax=Irpex rosettiformis TaxID=378272 RepID=A0ACB8TW87_9APHY|nr:SHQ1-domain-containing protein [Irpex rosettiformis]